MKVLIVGGDTKGAWQMRGVQLGAALGARVTAKPRRSDWAWADLVVLVKRAAVIWQAEARRVTVPVVWDVLDFWAQPEDNDLARDVLLAQVRSIQRLARVSVLIAATRAMADDIGGLYLPHHCRPGLYPAPIRARAEVVGYDGTPKYLGRWRQALEEACASLGLRFVVNPPDLREVDALVAFRDGRWNGWVCRQWKSGVKQVNALVAGRPILSQPSAAWAELTPGDFAISEPSELHDALQAITRREVREAAYEQGRRIAGMYQVHAVAAQYDHLLRQVLRRAA